MALRKIVTVGDPVLTKTCRPVTKFDARLSTLIDDMIETMHEANLSLIHISEPTRH